MVFDNYLSMEKLHHPEGSAISGKKDGKGRKQCPGSLDQEVDGGQEEKKRKRNTWSKVRGREKKHQEGGRWGDRRLTKNGFCGPAFTIKSPKGPIGETEYTKEITEGRGVLSVLSLKGMIFGPQGEGRGPTAKD